MIQPGEIRRIKIDQGYSVPEARGCLCVVERGPDSAGDYKVRYTTPRGHHNSQWMMEKHLEIL